MSDLKQSSVALLEKAIDDKIRKSQSKRDTTLATVTRVDNDGTTWVHVYGGADETPVRHMTSSAQVGDIINVTFSGLSCSGIGNVTSPSASQKQVQQVSAENAQAIRGVMEGLFQVKTVVAQKVSTRELDAEMATIISAAIDNATINALNAKYANINQIEAAYAKIDGANINTAAIRDAWVNNLLVQTGLLANDGTVFTLDAVQVDAANITTGTLDVRRLIVTRTIDGVDQKFVVNFDTSGNVTYTKLDGDVLGPQTVAAEKLVAHSITAEQLTIQNIVGTGGWINLANGTFAYGNPLTGQGITWDGSSLNISGSVRIGSSSKALSDMLTADDVTVTQNPTQTGYDVDIAGNTFSLLNGEQGPQGDTGATAQWYYGTALTHTSGYATLATSSTAGVVVGAMYLNKDTSLCYKCTAISGTTATWTYAGNLTDGVMDNINVGGRNLLKGRTTSSWTTNGITFEYDASTHISHIYGTNTKTDAVWTQSNFYMPSLLTDELIPGEEYTLTCYDLGGFSDSDLYVQLNTYITTGSQVGDWSVGKGRHNPSHTNTVRENHDHHDGWANLFMGVPTTVRDVDAKVRFKFEKGNVSTDYSPAPEDLAPAYAGVYYATCSTAAGTAVKVATTEQSGFTLVPGAMVNVKFTATNSAAVADLKLNVDGTGDKPIKYIYNNSLSNIPGVGYLLANNVYTFRYDGTNWVAQLMYNTDTIGRTRWQNVIKAAAAITNGYVICGTASGYRNVAAGVTFDLSYPLLYCATTKAAGETSDNNFLQINGIKITNNGTVTSAANYKTVYLVGTVSGNTFTVKASPFMTTVAPTSADGFFYIPLGVFYNSTTGIYFNSTKDLYAYIDGKFRQVTPTEVVAEQYIYCQSTSVVNTPTSPTAWVTESGESVSDDAELRENLLRNTDDINSADYVFARAAVTDGNIRLTPTTSASYAKAKVNYLDYSNFNGTTLTFSVEAKLADVESSYTSSNLRLYMGVNAAAQTGSIFSSSYDRYTYAEFTNISSEWSTYTFSKDIPGGLDTGTTDALVSGNFVTAQVAASGSKVPVDVRNFKLAFGGEIVGPTWTTKRPLYRTTHPALFVARQSKRLDGTVTCTTPIPDDTTTVIDGGHIITGILDASAVNVINLDATNITSGYISAERIEGGSLEISKLSDDLQQKFSVYDDGIESITAHGDRITTLEQTADAFSVTQEKVLAHDDTLDIITNRMSFSDGKLTLDASGGAADATKAVLSTEKLAFESNGTEVAYISNEKLYVTDAQVLDTMQMGGFAWIPRSNGNLSLKWVGE